MPGNYFERLREQQLAAQRRAAQLEAQRVADEARRQQQRRAYAEKYQADSAIARRVIEESGLDNKVREYCQITKRAYIRAYEVRSQDDESRQFKETLYTIGLSTRHVGDQTITDRIEIAAKPNGDIEIRGGLFGSTTIPENRWRSDSRGVCIENAIGRAAQHPIRDSFSTYRDGFNPRFDGKGM